ncbi:hypothetical protein E2C01_016169 [Portunus trituberculatus]|uniref:Uncharacterized protein n=1 Tax=Portunus trituberculatus TaxID=210409 RepID=A0A5B7DNP4_PORTR|nr:hypothetical protein [Portunus trituberculatus]
MSVWESVHSGHSHMMVRHMCLAPPLLLYLLPAGTSATPDLSAVPCSVIELIPNLQSPLSTFYHVDSAFLHRQPSSLPSSFPASSLPTVPPSLPCRAGSCCYGPYTVSFFTPAASRSCTSHYTPEFLHDLTSSLTYVTCSRWPRLPAVVRPHPCRRLDFPLHPLTAMLMGASWLQVAGPCNHQFLFRVNDVWRTNPLMLGFKFY